MSLRCKSAILFCLLLWGATAYSQSLPLPIKRSSESVLARDANVQGYHVAIIPVVSDTATALTYGVDSLGMLIQVRITGKQYKRDTVPTGGHVWTEIGSSSGSTYTADESSIHLSTGQFSIKNTYSGQPSITTLGTIATGTWQGTAIADSYISSAATWNAKLSAASTTNSVTGNGTPGSPAQLVGDAGSPGNSMYYGTNGSGAKGFYTLPSGVAGANPTTSIGLSPTNGVASTFMRSDAAPSLSQSITPTWTGTHTFNGSITMGSIIAFAANNTYQIGTSSAAASHVWSRAFNSDATATLSSTTGSPASLAIGANSGITLLSTGQAQLNNYTTSSSFTGTPLAFLQNDASGNIVQTPLSSVQSALSGTGYVKFSGTTPSYLTPTQATADLNVFTSSLQGLAPASGGGTTNFLRADGTWGVPPGTGGVSFANPSSSAGLTAVNGTATTAMRSDASPAISQSISPTWSGTHTFSNVPIISSLTGYIKGNGASALTASSTIPISDMATIAAHTYVGNNTASTATPAALTNTQLTADLNVFTSSLKGLAPSSGGGTTNFLRADGAWAAPSGGGGTPANPSASLGLTAINGSATTYMRSDAAPALDVSISPTWTGSHTHNNNVTFKGGGGTQVIGGKFFGTTSSDNLGLFLNSQQVISYQLSDTSWDSYVRYGFKGFGNSDSSDYIQTTRPVVLGIPVATFTPFWPNRSMSMDLVPSGPDSSANYGGNGASWLDACNRRLNKSGGVGLNYVGTARVASYLTHSDFGSVAFGGAATPDVRLIYGLANPFMSHTSTGTSWVTPNFLVNENSNAYNRMSLVNTNTGSGSGAAITVGENATASDIELYRLATGHSSSGLFTAGSGGIYVPGSATTSLNFIANNAIPILFANSGTERGRFDASTGNLLLGTTTNGNGFLTTAANTTTTASLKLNASAGVNVTSPTTGMLWWNGTNLYFYNGSSNVDLLAGGGSGLADPGSNGILKRTALNTTAVASAGDFPTLNQNTTGTAANLSGTPALPTGTTATTPSAGDNSTKLATTAYIDGLVSSGTYTPTITGTANITSTSPNSASYIKVGNIVHVRIDCGIIFTTNSTATTLTVSYPFTTATSSSINLGTASAGSTAFSAGIFQYTSSTLGTVFFTSPASGAGSGCNLVIEFDYKL
jgi:hypothetical protein